MLVSLFVGLKQQTISFLLDYPKLIGIWFVKGLLRKQCFSTLYKLTDQVYHYDVTDKVFEKASRYEDRRIEKEESKTFAGTKKTPRREDVSL